MTATKGKLQSNGLYDINLDSWQNSNYLGRIIVNSGAPGHQNFRTVPGEIAGNLEPCPEGEFDLGSLDWAGGKGNYDQRFQEINSPIWVTIYRRRVIGFHLDGNRLTAPGSAGCLVFKTMDDLKKFVNWWNGYGPFSKLYVDWGLGYVKKPAELRIK
jgi:hypothetical protein